MIIFAISVSIRDKIQKKAESENKIQRQSESRTTVCFKEWSMTGVKKEGMSKTGLQKREKSSCYTRGDKACHEKRSFPRSA